MVLHKYKDIDIKTDDFRVEAEFWKLKGSRQDDLMTIFNNHSDGYVCLLAADISGCYYDSNGKESDSFSKKTIVGITHFSQICCKILYKGDLRWTPTDDVADKINLSEGYKDFEPGIWFDLANPEEVVSGVLNFNLSQNGLEECVDKFEIILK